MKRLLTAAIFLVFVTLAGCARHNERQDSAARERAAADQESPAFKAGRVAHELAKQTEKAATVAGRKLEESARKAKAGWQEQARQDREKARTKQ